MESVLHAKAVESLSEGEEVGAEKEADPELEVVMPAAVEETTVEASADEDAELKLDMMLL